MRKIIIPLLALVPVILFFKFRKSPGTSITGNNIPGYDTADRVSGTPGMEKKTEVKPGNSTRKTTRTAARCKAVTGNGRKCMRKPVPDSEFCWQHS